MTSWYERTTRRQTGQSEPNIIRWAPNSSTTRDTKGRRSWGVKSYPGMIIPIATDAVGIFLIRQFFLQVPVALEEAGRIDGASTWQIYWSIVLPTVRPGLITLTIISFQGSWNQFQFFLIATISPKYYTPTTGLANLVNGGLSSGNQFPLKLGASLLTIIPMALMFFFLQKHLVRGRMEGAVKG